MTRKVSICIPAYRQTQYLKATLDSILCQGYDDYEVVIADDTRDSSVEDLVREYDFGSRLTYARNPTQLGSPANWNQAVRLSRGEYIKVLHHDDWLAGSSSLAEYVEMLDSSPNAGFAFSGATARIATSGKTWHHYASDRQIARLRVEPTCLFRGNFIGPPSSTMIRRGAFMEYSENLVWLVDIDQYIRILQATSFVATQKPLIVSTTQAAHQVTNLCAGNEKLNVYEYFFLFDAIKHQIPAHLRHAYIDHLIELIYSSKARSVEDIRQSGYAGDIPVEILSALQNSALARAWESLRFRLSRRLGFFEQPGR
jgi:glycosyltransferase involved in cell wall biosynthesis